MNQEQRLAIRPDQRQGNWIVLTRDQQHYLHQVLRLGTGDRFIAMDGQGHWWLTQFHPRDARAQILQPLSANHELPVPVILLAALPKGTGFDEVVRCTTELGVAGIYPILSERTLLRPSDRKLDRWRRIALEAAEQSQRQIIPTIHGPLPLDQAIAQFEQQQAIGPHRYLGVTDPTAPPLLHYLPPQLGNCAGLAVMVGPEGGWTEAEIHRAQRAGFIPISLGKRVLRAVTAPVAALSILAAHLDAG
jgi:16S rRNA (uracil1498-N3)-methyltransferase